VAGKTMKFTRNGDRGAAGPRGRHRPGPGRSKRRPLRTLRSETGFPGPPVAVSHSHWGRGKEPDRRCWTSECLPSQAKRVPIALGRPKNRDPARKNGAKPTRDAASQRLERCECETGRAKLVKDEKRVWDDLQAKAAAKVVLENAS